MMCFLYHVSKLFFLDIEVVARLLYGELVFSPCGSTVRDSALISAGVAAATVDWSQPGQVTPVTLHRPCRRKTLCVCSTAPPARNLAALVTLT